MRRVLIVEDEAAIRNLLAAILRRERIIADTAENGREALRLMVKHEYACIVLDLMMPVMNGREVVEALRDLPRRPPVILVTAAGDAFTADLPPDVVKLIIRKPFDVGRVVEAVQAFVARDDLHHGIAGEDRVM
jgi:two-component system, OmpR family, response regulator ResD